MAVRLKNKLTAAVVRQAVKPGYMSDGSGLVLQVTATGAKTWLFRYRSPAGRVREMGLGSATTVSLAAARLKAQEAQRLRDNGLDPLDVRREREAQAKVEAAKGRTFQWCAERFIEANTPGWRNEKHIEQWATTLATYAYPIFGSVPVSGIDTALIIQVLQPLWATKHETATRVRQRIERVLAWATTGGYRSGENPARWRGHLANLLPASKDVRKTQPIKHHSALAAEDVPALMCQLAEREGGSALGLRFLALTASRTGEVIRAAWSEVDMVAKVWTIPPSRMKSGKEHRVPLSAPALDILREAAKARVSDVVFNGPKPGHSLSNMAFAALLKRMERTDFVPHGLRSTFRTWAAERTNYPRELCEVALAHTVGDDTERSYQRGDMLERRRRLMNDWAKFATQSPLKALASKSVVNLRERKT